MKRKEQFLYDFNVSGKYKYKIFKERLKKVIVHLRVNLKIRWRRVSRLRGLLVR